MGKFRVLIAIALSLVILTGCGEAFAGLPGVDTYPYVVNTAGGVEYFCKRFDESARVAYSCIQPGHALAFSVDELRLGDSDTWGER